MKSQTINGHRVISGADARKFATPGSVHVDLLMTDFAINYRNLPFVGRQVMPYAPVTRESGKYAIFNADRRQEIPRTGLRAPKSRADVVDWVNTFGTFSAEEHAFAAGVDDRERDNADAPIDPDQRATAAATIALGLAAEVHAAQEAVQTDAGVLPNTAVIPYAVFHALQRNTEVRNAFSFGSAQRTGLVTREQLASYLEIDVDRLLIPGGMKNTAALGAAASLAQIWSDFAWFGFVDPAAISALDGITFGKSFRKPQDGQPLLTRQFRDDAARTDYKEVSEITDEKITAISCGYLVSDTLV